MTVSILVADPDSDQRHRLMDAIARLGYRPIPAAGGDETVRLLRGHDGGGIALVILDLVASNGDGMAVLAKLRALARPVPVIVQISARAVHKVTDAMAAGAIDFLVEPASAERLQISIENALKIGALEREVTRLKRLAAGTLTFRDIVGHSPRMKRIVELGERAAASRIPILIEGEPGVGKQMIARAIQGAGDRRSKPFVDVNCATIGDDRIETILFGDAQGAGSRDDPGRVRSAHGGTLFLEEVGALPSAVQARLLRLLDSGKYEAECTRRAVRVDIRLICTTSRSLIDLVKDGAFRDDLYYRLGAFPIRVPALRERREDLPELVRRFVVRFAAEEGKAFIRGVSASAMDLLLGFDWPGNVRQLENAVFRAVRLADAPMLAAAEFPQIAIEPPDATQARYGDQANALIVGRHGMANGASPTTRSPSHGEPVFDVAGEIRPLADVETAMIRLALDRSEGQMALAARKLGIGRSTLYRKLKGLGDGHVGRASATGFRSNRVDPVKSG